MKNKNGEGLPIVIVIILLVLAFIVVIWNIFSIYLEPEFIITKEECWNESYCGKLQSNMTINLSDRSNCSESIKKCEQVEVYEMSYFTKWNYSSINFIPCQRNNIDYECQGLCGLFGILNENLDWSKSPMENCEKSEGHFVGFNLYYDDINKETNDLISPRNISIKEEDLTINWLNENCECLENIEYTPNSAENSINVPCSKYKCENYFVEVK